jgi:phasin family protein
MTKSAFPFMDFDFARMMSGFKADAPELDGLMAAQKKNLEAIAEANRRAAEGFQAIMQRQSDMMRDAMTEASSAVATLSSETSPEARARKQAELMKKSFERTLGAMREIAEMAAESNSEIYDLLSKRAAETVSEFEHAAKGALRKPAKKS